MNTYREKVVFTLDIQKYVIKGKKGTLIYKDRRPNHIKGMIRFVEGVNIEESIEENEEYKSHVNRIKGINRFTQGIGVEQDPPEEYDYLIFDIQESIDSIHFEGQIELGNVQIQQFYYFTEFACHHPQVFTSGVLQVLQQLGYIKLVVKEIPAEAGRYPMYVNPKGWMHLYNFFSLLRQIGSAIGSGLGFENLKGKNKEA